MVNIFEKTFAILTAIVKNCDWGKIHYISPDTIGTNERYPIQYIKANRCNWYNKEDNNYTPWEIQIAYNNMLAKVNSAFKSRTWLPACPLQIAYVEEIHAFFVLDGQMRLAAALYLNELARTNGYPIPFAKIPIAVTYYETFEDALDAMDVLNDTAIVGVQSKTSFGTNEKRRVNAMRVRNEEYSRLYNNAIAQQYELPNYVDHRTGAIITYGSTKISDVLCDKEAPCSRIAWLLISNIFPKEIPFFDMENKKDKNKRERYMRGFEFPMILGMLANSLYRWDKYFRASKSLNTLTDKEVTRLAKRINTILFKHSVGLLRLSDILDNKSRGQKYYALLDLICNDVECRNILGRRFKSEIFKTTKRTK